MRLEPLPSDPRLALIVRATLRVGTGSGFVLGRGDRRFLLTAAHVVGDEQRIEVRWPGGSRSCTVLARDSEADVALVDVAEVPPEVPAIPIAPTEAVLAVGDEVWCTGFPDEWDGRHAALSRGHVAGVDNVVWIAVDAGFGSSGGPVVVARGPDVHAFGVIRGLAGKPENDLRQATAWADEQAREHAARIDELRASGTLGGSLAARIELPRGEAHVMFEFALDMLARHFRTGFVELVPIDRVVPLLPPD